MYVSLGGGEWTVNLKDTFHVGPQCGTVVIRLLFFMGLEGKQDCIAVSKKGKIMDYTFLKNAFCSHLIKSLVL